MAHNHTQNNAEKVTAPETPTPTDTATAANGVGETNTHETATPTESTPTTNPAAVGDKTTTPVPATTRFSVNDLGDIRALIALPEVEKKEHVTVNVMAHMVTEYRFGKNETFPAIEMTHPFNAFSDPIRIEIKHPSVRGKFNERFTRLRENAFRQGKNINELTFTGVLSLKSFVDKKNRTKAEYVAIDLKNIFDEGTLYARIPDKGQNSAFVDYGKHYLKVAETETNPDIGI